VNPEIVEAVTLARRAAGVVAARRRGDHEGAGVLMGEFDDPDRRAMGFYLVADLAVLLLSQATHRSIEDCVHDLTLALAVGNQPSAPDHQ
jgi:Fe-Mn family superoxide dismutase